MEGLKREERKEVKKSKLLWVKRFQVMKSNNLTVLPRVLVKFVVLHFL